MTAAALSERGRSLFVDGKGWAGYQAEGSYSGDSKALHACVGAMHQSGWSLDDVLQAFADDANHGARRAKALWGHRAPDELGNVWRRVQRRHDKHGERCDRWVIGTVLGWPHGGRYGGTLRVLLALIELARETGSLSFTADYRRIAEIAGTGWVGNADTDTSTVRRALPWLQGHGYVTTDHEPTVSRQETGVRISLASHMLDKLATHAPPKGSSSVCTHLRGCTSSTALHPLFEEAALGMNVGRVWFYLATLGEATAKAIADALRLNQYGVRKQLAAMETFDMLDQTPGLVAASYAITPGANLDAIAAMLSVLDRPERRRAANRTRRENRAVALGWAAPPLLGRVDPVTGEILRTDRKSSHDPRPTERVPDPTIEQEVIARLLGFTDAYDMETCLPLAA